MSQFDVANMSSLDIICRAVKLLEALARFEEVAEYMRDDDNQLPEEKALKQVEGLAMRAICRESTP